MARATLRGGIDLGTDSQRVCYWKIARHLGALKSHVSHQSKSFIL